MRELKVSPMIHAARRAMSRRTGSATGNFVIVGWDGKTIAGGLNIRVTLPHEKITVPPDMAADELAVEMTLAAARLKPRIAEALLTYVPEKATRDAARKANNQYGLYRTRRK